LGPVITIEVIHPGIVLGSELGCSAAEKVELLFVDNCIHFGTRARTAYVVLRTDEAPAVGLGIITPEVIVRNYVGKVRSVGNAEAHNKLILI